MTIGKVEFIVAFEALNAHAREQSEKSPHEMAEDFFTQRGFDTDALAEQGLSRVVQVLIQNPNARPVVNAWTAWADGVAIGMLLAEQTHPHHSPPCCVRSPKE